MSSNYAYYVTFADAEGIRSTRMHLDREISTVAAVAQVSDWLTRVAAVKNPQVIAWSRLPDDDRHPAWPPRL
jgi:hypothetical protein